ncbi:hypothetical protein ACUXV3_06680 [Roseobacteraceae bacterium NS-SX3]
MKQIVLPALTALVLTAAPASAEEENGQSLMERGAELFWEGLRKEMAPALDDMRALAEQFGPSLQAFLAEMGPALAEIAREVEDWSAYEMPEILPNGDIIIRRKPDDPEPKGKAEKGADEGVTEI